MTKKKQDKLTHTVESSKWEIQREKERITYPAGHQGPVQMNWRSRSNYSGAELSYRGKSAP